METVLAVAPPLILISFIIAIPSTVYWTYRLVKFARTRLKDDELLPAMKNLNKALRGDKNAD